MIQKTPQVKRCAQLEQGALQQLLSPYELLIEQLDLNDSIPGSFWGDDEAGLIDNRLVIRPDTPVHSALHEACHYICMDSTRRDGLHTDAGGGYDEENGVCYLQILLADYLSGMSSTQMMTDMDTWGYSFRLGSAGKWFKSDAADAANWLRTYGIIDEHGNPTWNLRY